MLTLYCCQSFEPVEHEIPEVLGCVEFRRAGLKEKKTFLSGPWQL